MTERSTAGRPSIGDPIKTHLSKNTLAAVDQLRGDMPRSAFLRLCAEEAIARRTQPARTLREIVRNAHAVSCQMDQAAYEAELGRGLDAMELVAVPQSDTTATLGRLLATLTAALPYDAVEEG